jgi:acyl dehydratase
VLSANFIFNKIPLENIRIGMQASYSQTVTDADIKAFSGASGDRNPIHLDEVYAEGSRYKKRIAHGFMTASYFSALFGTKIPGEGCVYVSQSLKFKKPVYIGDTVTATVEVTSIDKEKRRVFFKTTCKVGKKIVTDGEAEIFIPRTFKKIIINNKEELLKYKKSIFKLYKDSFGQAFEESIWHWAYIENPNGDPIVSLYFDGEKLVGHYAVIPVSLVFNGIEIKAGLSMTTMVDSSYRKHGIFITQADETYQKAKELGYKLVYGFPNKKSAPGFKKRLEWILEEDLYVAKLNKKELLNLEKEDRNCIEFNISNEDNLKWRLDKPSQEYIQQEHNIYKKFGDELDIVFNKGDFSDLKQSMEYNILLNEKSDEYVEKKQFDYIFGYRLFDKSLSGIDFKKDLLMSDIF